MDVIIKRCAGLDVHKKSVTACVRVLDEAGTVQQQVRTWGTMSRQILELADWLALRGVTHVAMESTGVLWKPLFNILEGQFTLLLVNAQHLKKVPGRKTDVGDSQWIAQLLQYGLLSPSFVPERPQRELRDLTRQRAQLTGEKSREINRIHKVLEDANIKLGAVATDIMGVSGRLMLRALIAGGQPPEQMAELSRGRLREKIAQLELALEGRVGEHHRFLLKLHLEHVEYLEGLIERLSQRIEALMAPPAPPPQEPPAPAPAAGQPEPVPSPLGLAEAAELLDEIPGVDRRGAQDVLAEIGTDMGRFASAKHLCSWARMCPGNDQSAGKSKSGKRGRGNRWLRRVLGQLGWAAQRAKGSYLGALFRRLARKRGKQRAIVAVGHSLLVMMYHMLKYHRRYHELGADFLDRLEPERVKRYHLERLQALGYDVKLLKEPLAA
jgi:transposase